MKTPLIVTNFKVYETSIHNHALKLSRIHQQVAEKTNASIGVAVPAIDLQSVCLNCENIPVFAQHIDIETFGRGTGKVLAEHVKMSGATGTLLNHSEYRLDWETLTKTVARAKEAGLTIMVCAQTPEEGAKIAKELDPDFIAVEPPELIGGDISVSTAQPEIIEKAAELIGSDKLIVGAGVKNAEDVRIALKLGACGVLLASGITKADDPEVVLMDLVEGTR